MIWTTWRQFRAQVLTATAALAAVAVYLVVIGNGIRNTRDTDLAACHVHGGCSALMNTLIDDYALRFYLAGGLLIAVPGIMGIFWGAPLIARELETGTHRLVWNQSVTRSWWLAAKLLVTTLVAVAVAGALSLLLTWSASPFDALRDDRWTALPFASRNVTPLGYAAFAFILGVAAGLFIRRTVPAMALTLAVVAAVQLAVPAVRPHLISPTTVTTRPTATLLTGEAEQDGNTVTLGVKIPGALMVSTSPLLDPAGRPVNATEPRYLACLPTPPGPGDPRNAATPELPPAAEAAALADCFGKQDARIRLTYQPANRYWTFQWLETTIFLVLAAVLVGLCFWRIRRPL